MYRAVAGLVGGGVVEEDVAVVFSFYSVWWTSLSKMHLPFAVSVWRRQGICRCLSIAFDLARTRCTARIASVLGGRGTCPQLGLVRIEVLSTVLPGGPPSFEGCARAI